MLACAKPEVAEPEVCRACTCEPSVVFPPSPSCCGYRGVCYYSFSPTFFETRSGACSPTIRRSGTPTLPSKLPSDCKTAPLPRPVNLAAPCLVQPSGIQIALGLAPPENLATPGAMGPPVRPLASIYVVKGSSSESSKRKAPSEAKPAAPKKPQFDMFAGVFVLALSVLSDQPPCPIFTHFFPHAMGQSNSRDNFGPCALFFLSYSGRGYECGAGYILDPTANSNKKARYSGVDVDSFRRLVKTAHRQLLSGEICSSNLSCSVLARLSVLNASTHLGLLLSSVHPT